MHLLNENNKIGYYTRFGRICQYLLGAMCAMMRFLIFRRTHVRIALWCAWGWDMALAIWVVSRVGLGCLTLTFRKICHVHASGQDKG